MRSNQYTTRQVITTVKDYLNGLATRSKKEFGLTASKIVLDENDKDVGFLVTLGGRPILKINKDPEGLRDVYIFSGFYYDTDGNPTNLTRERLNGLLDFLGDENVIPRGVRVIFESESNVCFVHCNGSKTVLNRDYCNIVGVKADPEEFQFVPIEERMES